MEAGGLLLYGPPSMSATTLLLAVLELREGGGWEVDPITSLE